MKNLAIKAESVETFHKRMTAVEIKLQSSSELQEKRMDSLKEYLEKTKLMLEARCEQITQYNDKLLTLRDQINTEKNYI